MNFHNNFRFSSIILICFSTLSGGSLAALVRPAIKQVIYAISQPTYGPCFTLVRTLGFYTGCGTDPPEVKHEINKLI